MNRRTFLSTLAILWSTAAACSRSEKKIIGVAPKGSAALFWETVHAGVLAAGQDHDVEILWNAPTVETDYTRQIQIVEAMINRRVDGIVLSPAERTSLVGVVERAAAAGIPVTIFDSGIETDQYLSYVATDNAGAGRLAAQTMAEMLGGSGKVAVIRHAPGSASTEDRERAFEAAVAEQYTGIEIVTQLYDMDDRARALAVTEDILTAHPDIDGLFASAEVGTVGAARAVQSRGLVERVFLLGFDSSPSMIEDLKGGIIDALIVQDPFQIGYVAVQTIVQKLSGETPQRLIHAPARVVRAADLDDPEVYKLLNPDLDRFLK